MSISIAYMSASIVSGIWQSFQGCILVQNSGGYSNGFDTKIIFVSIQSIKKEIKITFSFNIHLYITMQILKC
jgi:hypothetical protein